LKSGEEGRAGSESLPEPRFELLFKVPLEVDELDKIEQTHAGNRHVIGVSGGVFEEIGAGRLPSKKAMNWLQQVSITMCGIRFTQEFYS
jgi:hypothetical protein